MIDSLRLKKSNCKNCYKCIRNCPVKSIRFSANQAHIIGEECILCGQCFVVCPQNAKEITKETEKTKVIIQSGDPVYASLAPSFIARFPGIGINGVRAALLRLGFAGVEETAIGATIVKRAYDEMLLEGNRDILISSCCHSVNLLIQKHFPNNLRFLADVLSPMQAHAADIRRRIPNAKIVFIGPCVAKKDEAQRYGDMVDAVLTFEELENWLSDAKITLKPEMDSNDDSRARLFPTRGGIIKTMTKAATDYDYIAVDGLENCIKALEEIEIGAVHRCFIEMSACEGSCIGGPVMEKYRQKTIGDYLSVAKYAGRNDFDTAHTSAGELLKGMPLLRETPAAPSEAEIREILKQMGKTKPEDELNCASCGYDTCRDKAAAIYQGKADISMCLPFLNEKAENFSENIVNNTPNGIVVLNEGLEVQQINHAARLILNVRNERDVLGEPVIRILDPMDFINVQQLGKDVVGKRTYIAEYNKYVERTIVHDKDYHLLICIMRDVTNEETLRNTKESMRKATLETADKVVDKQMRIVQEIASLLGETAAETKIALSKLKEAIRDE